MITSTVTIYALPEAMWQQKTIPGKQTISVRSILKNALGAHTSMEDSLGIYSFVKDALGIETRIQKGINQENERARYNLCCARLEAAIKIVNVKAIKNQSEFKSALASPNLPVITVGQNYLDSIRLMYQNAEKKSIEMRLGTTFFPPNIVTNHINAFASLVAELELSQLEDLQQRIEFFQFASKYQCGIVEIQNSFNYQKQETQPSITLEKVDGPGLQIQAQDSEGVFDNEGKKAYEILCEQVDYAIKSSREEKQSTINFSNQPHNIIADVLNKFAYSDSGKIETPIYIKVIYTDGSQAKKFPLRCLPNRKDKDLGILKKVQPLKAALLSMRHLEMDHVVDVSWFRNREVSKSRSFAETDQYCYTETLKQLEETRDNGVFTLHLYQTGLQPAIIGFYRALIEELLYRAKSPSSLEVIPFYYRGKSGYEPGESWH
jgi:hypothetical protein